MNLWGYCIACMIMSAVAAAVHHEWVALTFNLLTIVPLFDRMVFEHRQAKRAQRMRDAIFADQEFRVLGQGSQIQKRSEDKHDV